MSIKKLRLSAAVVLAILAIVLIMQNLEPVETKLLFVTMVMPRAALLAVTMLIGIATGILISLGFSGKYAKKNNKSQPQSVSED